MTYLSICQNFDTAKVLLNAKFQLLDFSNDLKTKDFILKFADYPITYKFLKSNNFKGITFFTITTDFEDRMKEPFQVEYDSIKKIKKEQYYLIFTNFRYRYLFAYNKIVDEIYRLNGTENNDFEKLINDMPGNYRELDKEDISEFYIEGYDIQCWIKWIKSKKRRKCTCYDLPKQIYDIEI